MAHVRPDAKVRKHRASACRKGQHLYGAAQYIGGGIARQVCDACGAVSIDLRPGDDEVDTALVDSHVVESPNGEEP